MKGVADVYPLTSSQLGILYDSLRDPDPELYFEQVRFDLVGDVQAPALRQAWNDTIDAHPALRTVWLWEGLDDPVQVVRERVDLPWTEIDMTSAGAQREALDDLARRDRSQGFDLRRPPVSRVTVVRLAHDRRHVIWSFHHIMLDGWSTARVLDEILDRCAGQDVATAPPFRDHVAWTNAQDHTLADAHWRRLLDGFDQPTHVAGRRAGEDESFDRARTTISLDEDMTGAVIAAARADRVTVNTIVQAAWAVTLSCLSGDDDVVFGVTGSGRPAEIAGVESIIGMFLSTLPMRVRIDRDRSVRDLWRAVQEQQLDLTQFQYSSLAEIAHQSAVPAGVPLFETALVFENFPRPENGGRDFTVERHEVFEQTRFPLTVMVGVGNRLDALALYDRSQFEDGTVEALLDAFRHVLARMVADPGLASTSVSTLTDSERQRLLTEVNQTDRPVLDSTVHDEIAAHARHDSDSLALIDGERSMSYGELDEAGRALARRLVAQGVASGDAVLVAVDRSIDAVVAMLAVMQSGAAYVPVDPRTPVSRLRSVAEDAHPSLAVTTSPHGDALAALGVPVMVVPDRSSAGETGSLDAPGEPSAGSAEDTMFVVFTSGSTGRPKGVPGSHRAVLNRCAWEAAVAPHEPDEMAAQKTTSDFVDHVAELWAPLVAGRPVVIISDEVVRRPAEFLDALTRHRVRRIVMVPSLLGALLEAFPDLGERVPDLRRWTLSGERLEPALVDRFRTQVPNATLVNVYGMSEVMADATAFEVWSPGAADSATRDPVPIGRPIDNQRVYVIDRAGRLAPVGVPGEIHISGVGVMAGYWRRDDLTAERITPNPFGDGHHARWYATGDIGRWSPDGQLEYLGRADRQVKVRGVRVELGDIEAAVRQLPGVTDSVVVDVSSAGAPTRLRAHLVTDDGVDLADARRRLAELVPSALVPAELARVREIPLLPSGKVDRSALANGVVDVGADTPVTDDVDDGDLETMVEIWREVIENERVGPDDDFFDVGGHSIAGMRLLARIKRTFDVNLELAILYGAATPRTLTDEIHRAAGSIQQPGGDVRHLVPITTGADHDRTLYCVHGAGGNVLNFRDLARALAPDWGLVGIQASGVDGVSAVHGSIDEMCEAYISALQSDRPDGPIFLAGFSSGGIVAFEMAARLMDRGRDVGAVVLLDTFHPLVRGRRRTIGEHLGALAREGPAYLVERRRKRRRRHLYENATQIVDDRRQPGQPVPHELRDPMLVSNTLSIIAAWSPRRYDGRVRLFAAADVLDVFAHAGPDRGWAPWAPDLQCAIVPGGHQDFIVDPHASELAEVVRVTLERSLTELRAR